MGDSLGHGDVDMLERLLLPELRQYLNEQQWSALDEFCTIVHPSVLADMFKALDNDELLWQAFAHLDPQHRVIIFEYLPKETQDLIVGKLPEAELVRLLEQMSHDDRADLVKRMDEDLRDHLLPLVAKAEREDIIRLTKYPEGTAGAIMTTDYASLPAELTVGEALSRLRQEAPNRETIYYIYVIDAQRRLMGFVSLKDLILSSPGKTIAKIMRADPVYVQADEDVEQVASVVARYDLLALPVVDPEKRLIGIITHDDVIDVVEEEATEDVHRLGGVDPLAENYLEAPFLTVWRKRTVWLLALFVAELFTFTAMAHFEDAIQRIVVLSLFIPLCISTGGNSGSQAATLITRSMALGHVEVSDWLKVLWHELGMGVALGVTLGTVGFFRALLTPHSVLGNTSPWLLALTISQSVAVICLWGTLVGSLLPLGFKKIGVDPGYASSPFVATFVDVTGIVLYFSIAHAYLL